MLFSCDSIPFPLTVFLLIRISQITLPPRQRRRKRRYQIRIILRRCNRTRGSPTSCNGSSSTGEQRDVLLFRIDHLELVDALALDGRE